MLAYPEASDTGDLPGVGTLMEGVRFGPLDVPADELPVRKADEAAASYKSAVIYYGDGLSREAPHHEHRRCVRPWQFRPGHIDLRRAAGTAGAPLAVHLYRRLQGFPRAPGRRMGMRERREWMDLTGDMSFHVAHPENFHGR